MRKDLDIKLIKGSLSKLEKYILKERYKGYDPFDVLTSPLFNFSLLKNSNILRLTAQQIFKRLPINLRPLIVVKKRLNPVTLGLCLQAFCNLIKVSKENDNLYKTEVDFCINKLMDLSSPWYSGKCWGYDFDWESRYTTFPAYTPTVVATGFITNALFTYYKLTGNEKAIDLCKSSVNFIVNDLNKYYEEDTFCYSYSPLDKQKVLNATMKGARLLMQVYSVTKDIKLRKETEKTVMFVINHQKENGSWLYSLGDARDWIDNFHTGYILDCLDEYIKISGDNKFVKNLEKGINYYVNNFFTENNIPKYFNNSTYPIDTTAAAQSILTLTRFSYLEKAVKVSEWMINHMQHKEGYFYFQKHRFYKNKINYMRWSNAWMYLALSNLIYNITTNEF